MAYVKVVSGNTGSSSEINANFQWVGLGDWLPRGGQALDTTNGVYDLGSDSKYFKTLYCDEVATCTVSNSWQFVASHVVLSQTLVIDFTGLNGDEDNIYRMFGFIRTTSSSSFIRINSDSTLVYREQFTRGVAGVVQGGNTISSVFRVAVPSGSNSVFLFDSILYAKTGYERTMINNIVWDAKKAVAGAIVSQHQSRRSVWNNTTSTITSLQLHGILDINTNIRLYKRT